VGWTVVRARHDTPGRPGSGLVTLEDLFWRTKGLASWFQVLLIGLFREPLREARSRLSLSDLAEDRAGMMGVLLQADLGPSRADGHPRRHHGFLAIILPEGPTYPEDPVAGQGYSGGPCGESAMGKSTATEGGSASQFRPPATR
jgi:hypothetical protein